MSGTSVTSISEQSEEFGANQPSTIVSLLIFLIRHTFLGRGQLRRFFGKLVMSLHEKPFDVSVWGAKVRLYPTGNLCDFKVLFSPNNYCHKELKFLDGHLQREGAVFFDIGANSGFFSLYMGVNAKKKRQIFAFEPNPDLVKRIESKFNRPENKQILGQAILTLCPYALGSERKKANLNIPEENLGTAHIDEAADDGIEVDVYPLKDVIAEHGIEKIDALKIDVEGYEDKVLEPLFTDVDKKYWPTVIIIEHFGRQDWEFDCIGEAMSRGYQEVFKTRINTALELSD